MTGAGTVLVVPLADELIDDVIRIHRAGLGYTLNSLLGGEHMSFLYRTMARDDACYVGVALVDGRPAGVVSGSCDVASFTSRLLRQMGLTQLAGTAIRMLLQPHLAWLWWLGTRIARPVSVDSQEVKAVLTALAVDADVQGRGVGRALVSAFEDFLRRAGVGIYKLDTKIKNEAAARFYEGLGFAEVARRADSKVFVRRLI